MKKVLTLEEVEKLRYEPLLPKEEQEIVDRIAMFIVDKDLAR